MSKKRVKNDLRVFAVIGDLGEGDELSLDQVLSWASFDHLRRFCNPAERAKRTAWDMVTKKVMLGEYGATTFGGMTIRVRPFEEADSWKISLGQDRPVRELRDGDVVTMLKAKCHAKDGAALWTVYGATTGGTLSVVGEKLVIAGIPGANT